MINFEINMNGDSAENIFKQQVAIRDAADALLKALEDGIPHGRNYQTAEEGTYENDHKMVKGFIKMVAEIEMESTVAALRAQDAME